MSAIALSARRTLHMYWLESRSELLKAWRMPAYSLPTIAFPVFFYVLFGVTFGSSTTVGGTTMAGYLVATYGAFGVIGAAMFGVGVGVAVERGQGWLLLKRATPMPPTAYVTAKVLTSLVFGALVVALLGTLGATLGDVRLAASQWLSLAIVLIGGTLPFCACGLAIGFLAGPNSAPAVVNLIYLPASFLSGLWIPVEMLPPPVRAVAPLLPPYHLGQLALSAIGAGHGGAPLTHVAVLLGFALASVAAAVVAFRRDRGRTWG